MNSDIILVHDGHKFSDDVCKYLKAKHPGLAVISSEYDLKESLENFSGTIVINSFPDRFHRILESADPSAVNVICCAPIGRREPYNNGLGSIEGIFRFSNSGLPEFFTAGNEEDIAGRVKQIFGDLSITTVDQEDIDLMSAELIIRPLIVSLIAGRLIMEGERTLLAKAMKDVAIPVYAMDISLARDALRFNRFASDSFNDIERKLREVWNDLSNY